MLFWNVLLSKYCNLELFVSKLITHLFLTEKWMEELNLIKKDYEKALEEGVENEEGKSHV